MKLKIKSIQNEEGQTLIELCISVLIILITCLSITQLIQSEWKRTQCAYHVFEATHSKLIGDFHEYSGIQMQFEETQDYLRGRGTCGKIKEVVILPKLESASW